MPTQKLWVYLKSSDSIQGSMIDGVLPEFEKIAQGDYPDMLKMLM